MDLDADHYWCIDSADAFDLSTEPNVVAGHLEDDAEEIRDLLGRSEVFLWHDLDHLIGLLSRLAALDRL